MKGHQDGLVRTIPVNHKDRPLRTIGHCESIQYDSAMVMAGTPIEVFKKSIGHGSEEMIRRYTHLRPDFMRDELARVPDFAPETVSKIAEMAPVAPQLAVAV